MPPEKRLDLEQESQVTSDLVTQVAVVTDGKFLKKSSGQVIGSNISGLSVDIAGVSDTSGDFSPGAVLVPVPGTLVNFTSDRPGKCFFAYSCFFSGFSAGFATSTSGLRVDGIDFTLQSLSQNNGAGGDFTSSMPHSGELILTLPDGPHTVQLIAAANAFSVVKSGSSPATVTAIFPSGTTATGGATGGAALTSVEAATVGALDAFFSNPTLAFVPVPGTAIAFALPESKHVYFSADATSPKGGAVNSNCQIGIRVDGIDYPGTLALSVFVAPDNGRYAVTAHKALLLAPGAHTAEIVIRMNPLDASPAIVFTDATKPARLTAIYTIPIFGVGSLSKTDVQSTIDFLIPGGGAYSLVPGTAISIFLNTDQVVFFEGWASSHLNGFGSNDSSQLGIRIDGVDHDGVQYAEHSAPTAGSSIGEVYVSIAISLLAGSHTAQLVAKVTGGGATLNGAPSKQYLVALYTNPEQVAPSLIVEPPKVKSDGNVSIPETGGVNTDVPGVGVDPTFEIDWTQNSPGVILVFVTCAIEVAIRPAVGLNLAFDDGAGFVDLSNGYWNGVTISLPGQTTQAFNGGGIAESGGSGSFHVALTTLTAGPKKIKLRMAGNFTGFGALGIIGASAPSPLRMTVIHQ